MTPSAEVGAVVPAAEAPKGERSEPAGAVVEGTTAATGEAVIRRRHFSAAFKRRIVKEAEASASTPGALTALLRREGLYSAQLGEWRKAASAGLLAPGQEPKVGRPAKDGLSANERKLARENERLKTRLRHAELIIEVQKKVAALLELTPPPEAND